MQTNFFINNILEVMALQNTDKETSGGHITCENCETNDTATTRCKVCCMFLCEFCTQSHRRTRATKQHRLMTIEEVKAAGPAALTKTSFCSKHKQETLKLFCHTCDHPICRDCIIVEHREHRFVFIEDALVQQKQNITRSLELAKDNISSLTTAIESVEKVEKSVEASVTVINGEIDKFLDKVVAVVESKRKSLKEDLKRTSQEKVKQLQSQRGDLSFSLGSFQSSVNFAEDVLKKCDGVEVLSMKKQITQRFEKLSAKKYNYKPCETDNIAFEVQNKGIDTYILNAAVISSKRPPSHQPFQRELPYRIKPSVQNVPQHYPLYQRTQREMGSPW